MVEIGFMETRLYTANATTTTQKQSDYEVEQSSFTLIALFLQEIGRCRGRNWLYGNQALQKQLSNRQLFRYCMSYKRGLVELNCNTLVKLKYKNGQHHSGIFKVSSIARWKGR